MTCIPIDITKDEQFAPDYLKINPNNKIPSIVDHDTNASLMESGAILLYLAEKTGKFIPPGRSRPLEDVAMADVPGGRRRTDAGARRIISFNSIPARRPMPRNASGPRRGELYSVMDKRLGEAEYLAGDDYTDRRYRNVAVGFPVRMAGHRSGAIPECAALVSRHRGSAGGSTRL